jgi:hypothetical protein
MNDDPAELIQKLNIKPDSLHITLHAPDNYLNGLPLVTVCKNIEQVLPGSRSIQAFYTSRANLQKELPKLKIALNKNGQLWICWPKKSSGVSSDLSDANVRRIGLGSGLVDVKVAAIDETWSGLKFVFRLIGR